MFRPQYIPPERGKKREIQKEIPLGEKEGNERRRGGEGETDNRQVCVRQRRRVRWRRVWAGAAGIDLELLAQLGAPTGTVTEHLGQDQ